MKWLAPPNVRDVRCSIQLKFPQPRCFRKSSDVPAAKIVVSPGPTLVPNGEARYHRSGDASKAGSLEISKVSIAFVAVKSSPMSRAVFSETSISQPLK